MPTYWVNIYAEPQFGHILTCNWVNFPKMPTYWVNIYAEPQFGHNYFNLQLSILNLQLGKTSQLFTICINHERKEINAYILGKHLRRTTIWAYFNLQLGKLSPNAYILGKHLRGTSNWAYFNLQLGRLSPNAYILGKHLPGTTNWAYFNLQLGINSPKMPIYYTTQ